MSYEWKWPDHWIELFGKQKYIPETCRAALHPHMCDWKQLTEDIAARNLGTAELHNAIKLKLPGVTNDDSVDSPASVTATFDVEVEEQQQEYLDVPKEMDDIDLSFAKGPADASTGRKIDRDLKRTFPLFNTSTVSYDLPLNHRRLRRVLRALASTSGYGFYTQGTNLVCALVLLGSFRRYPRLNSLEPSNQDDSSNQLPSDIGNGERNHSGSYSCSSGEGSGQLRSVGSVETTGESGALRKASARERQVYAVIRALFDDCKLLQLYQNATPALDVYIHCFSKYLENKLPAVSRRLQEVNFATHAFAIEWFTALFSTVTPLHVGLCIVDLLVSGKVDNILFRLAVAILNNIPGLSNMSEDELMLSIKPMIMELDFAKIFREAMNIDSESDVLTLLKEGIHRLPSCYREAISPMETLLNEELLASPTASPSRQEEMSSNGFERSALLRKWRRAQQAYVPITRHASIKDVDVTPSKSPTHKRHESEDRWLDVQVLGHETSDGITLYKIQFCVPSANFNVLVLRRYSHIRSSYMKIAAEVDRCLQNKYKRNRQVKLPSSVVECATIEERDEQLSDLIDETAEVVVSRASEVTESSEDEHYDLDALSFFQEDKVEWHSSNDMPPLPPKKVFGSKNPDFIQQRQQELHTLFRALTHPSCPLFGEFSKRYSMDKLKEYAKSPSRRQRSLSIVAQQLASEVDDSDVFSNAREAFFELFNTSEKEIVANIMKTNFDSS